MPALHPAVPPCRDHPPSESRRPRRLGALVAVVVLAAALVVPVVRAGSADAVATPQSDAAAAWLAGLVGPDGAVANPNSGDPSVSGTVQVALALVAAQTERAAIDRAVGYIEANVDGYVAPDGADSPGRLGYLLLLAHATGADPTSYGTSGVDLVARLQATYEISEAGFFGTPDPYNSVFNQSLAIVGLVAVGAPVPAGAPAWLTTQQCDSGNTSDGGWVGYRAESGGALVPCEPSSGIAYTGADSNGTAMAVQALAASGTDGPIPTGLAFLASTQSPTTGGFGYYAGDTDDDPNSTALGIQALVATGQDPTGGSWSVGGGTPYSALVAWQLTAGPDSGALASPYSSGEADLLATFQGLWGLSLQPFPFPVLPAPSPTTTTTAAPTTTSTTPTDPDGSGADRPGGRPVTVVPAFTG